MERETAEKVVKAIEQRWKGSFSLFDAMAMTKIITDGYETYAIQKGDVTFVAWIRKDGSVSVKTLCW